MPPTKSRKIAASKKKKQTRLTFDPVDLTSSPAPPGPSPAKVRYAILGTARSAKTIPSSSMQDDSESDDIIVLSAARARDTPMKAPKKNGKLPFKKGPLPTPLKSSQMLGGGTVSSGTLGDSEDEIANTTSMSRPTRNSAPKPFSSKMPIAKKAGIHVDGGSSDGSDPEESTSTPLRSKKGKGKTSKSVVNITSDDYEEDAAPATANSEKSSRNQVVIFSPNSPRTTVDTPSKTKQQKGKPTVLESSEIYEEDDDDELPEVQKLAASGSRLKRDSKQKNGVAYVELSSDPEGEDIELPQNSSRSTRKPTLFSTVPKGRSSSPIPAPDSSGNKLHSTRKMLINRSRKLLFGKVPKGKSSSPQAEDSEESQAGEDTEEDTDDDVVMSTQHSRRKRPVAVFIDNKDEDDSDIQISSPLKRRRAAIESDDSDIASSPSKRKRPNPVYSEDEEDVPAMTNKKTPSRDGTPQNRTTRQTGHRRHRTEKEKKLELLKRRRAGEHIEELTESEETGSEDDSGSELQKLSEFEDEEEEEVVVNLKKPNPKKRQKSVANGSDEDKYDSDFIEDDDDGNLGVPMHSLLDIPLEFTHAAHKPLKEHFKDAVEWMIHAKINPGFARDDPVYVQAFRKLDTEYAGLADSKFVSTQWTPEFTRAIYARPEFLVRDLAPGEEITIAGEVICQVCNHRKYVPKFEIQFAGKAYHKDSLEEVEHDDSSDDSDGVSKDSQKRSVNENGQEIPPEEKCWLSGQYCKANAEQAHSLIHWKHALNQWVLGNLEAEGYLTPDKLAEREKLKSKQRRKYANDIVDDWEAHSQIKDLYRDFKINLEGARNANPANFKNGRFGRG